MIHALPFITTLIFTFGRHSSTAEETSSKEALSNITSLPSLKIIGVISPYNEAAIVNGSESVHDYILYVKHFVTDLQSMIDFQASQKPIQMIKNKKLRGASVNDFLFGASIVRESAAKVISLADDIEQKMQLIENEANLKLLTARLIAGGNRTSVDNWVRSKFREIKEDIENLSTRCDELSEHYQMHLSNLAVLKSRLAVDATYGLFDSYSVGTDENSPKEICRNGIFSCKNGVRNITCVKYCNGYSECGDESDEPASCSNLFSHCPTDVFRCDDGQCIDDVYRCQHRSDDFCRDESHMDYCS